MQKLEAFFDGVTLTEQQRSLLGELERFFADRKRRVFLLRGYAGTGKTFLLRGVTAWLEAREREMMLAAPTGKAAKVLGHKTGRQAYTMHKSIYSQKDIREYREEGVDGSETYKFYFALRNNEDASDTVYIVDEASMVGDRSQEGEFFRFGSGRLLSDWIEYVNPDHNDHDKKLIFVGDAAQLPPVGMDFSPALDAGYLRERFGLESTEFELTEVVRQRSGSAILRQATKLRRALAEERFDELLLESDGEEIVAVDPEKWREAYLRASGGRLDDETILIARSNRLVQGYNRQIREAFFPGRSEITAGDRIIVTANNYAHERFISNGEFGTVMEADESVERVTVPLKKRNETTGQVETLKVALSFRRAVIRFRDPDGMAFDVEGPILENLLESQQPGLSSEENRALYIHFLMRHRHLKRGTAEFRDALMDDPYFNALKVKYGYAITAHKAQGSEWKRVFLHGRTGIPPLSRESFRWFYTALTRSRERLYTLYAPRIAYGSTLREVPRPVARQLPPEGKPAAASTPSGSLEEWIAAEVRRLLEGSGVAVERVEHQQYCELYHFSRGPELAAVRIHYNGKGRVSRILPAGRDELSVRIAGMLAPMEGASPAERKIPERPGAGKAQEPNFAEAFLRKHYEFLRERLEPRGIRIEGVEHHPWLEKYRFRRGEEHGVINFHYNGKKRFSSYAPEYKRGSSEAFLREIVDTIKVEEGAVA